MLRTNSKAQLGFDTSLFGQLLRHREFDRRADTGGFMRRDQFLPSPLRNYGCCFGLGAKDVATWCAT